MNKKKRELELYYQRLRVGILILFSSMTLGYSAWVLYDWTTIINQNYLYFTVLVSPILAVGFLMFEPSRYWVRFFGVFYSAVIFLNTVVLFNSLNFVSGSFQIYMDLKFFYVFNWGLTVGLDNFSILFVVLTAFLTFIIILSSWSNSKYILFFYILFFFSEFLLFLVFSALDFIFFFIVYESVIVPVFLIIGLWGGRPQKVYAAYMFFYYTFVGSIFMLFGIIYIYMVVGSTSFLIVSNFEFTFLEQVVLFFAFFIGFAAKLPLYPLHSWLPEAHVEAPTAGSVLLAGILLKMGTYGLVRWCINFFPDGAMAGVDVVNTISVVSILYASLAALQQLDIKRIIAYSSISHMAYVVIGLFTFTEYGFIGSIFLMVSHGVVSAGLFLAVGVLYDRYGSRSVLYYGGMGRVMPRYDTVFFGLCLANMALPGTVGFPGEFVILYSVCSVSPALLVFLFIGVFFTGVYTIWLYCRVMMGPIDSFSFIKRVSDLSFRELFVFVLIMGWVFIVGLFPNFLFSVYADWVSAFFMNVF